MEDLFRVPNTAGGTGFEPADSFNDRWLDGRQLQKGDCVPYLGRACRNYLTDKFVMITTENRDDIYDIGWFEFFQQNWPSFSTTVYLIIISNRIE